jgi:hypothetical protein
VTRAPATSVRSRPCQPSPTTASGPTTVSQSSPTSPATGTSDQPAATRHESGTGTAGSGRPTATAVWTRPVGVSTLWKIGPSSRSTRSRSTPASRRVSSSRADRATASTPTTAAVRNPSRAVASAA